MQCKYSCKEVWLRVSTKHARTFLEQFSINSIVFGLPSILRTSGTWHTIPEI
ncbi:uncharacterized protein LACBIDRAFT_302854 [Laccaria bicolor S238N-H82]|uniref:Predicted protein n=1 Tax=Laccaria bicolor (strain S238N-H82 / ATCC MYA-4686) TaxID=486041 RepID=B0DIG3_LACBS|nr:uncharacterized protein LACBIDRAFT_302854 [Laccaria bicolor S238N-H82]EDR05561.1 predicted protein [Laccaria bicolor S238N-H82]|eukprot:XP_001883665.1 predicted protein [Laccaria bicolor S238N-H82]